MNLKLSSLNEEYAKQLSNWKYNDIYSVYNYPSWDNMIEQKWAITDEKKRAKQFIAVVDNSNNLCGYGRFLKEDNFILLGLGLKPCLCGKNSGDLLVKLLVDECNKRYDHKDIILEVRSFNIRAIKCYLKNGFEKIDFYKKNTLLGKEYFWKMKYK
ncbi:GCN5 family acetyltransferase [Clostridium botulinum]|uniref:GNAT family N-acetyltransferase n=1 Tax=Clostridium botulinum TaxID=1491 RepID=UPI000174E488|nr:GNAT family N-acetyltransferase [Clostridium botulinum]ACD54078.1 acetyltransferase, GNAT family [Clostridium botulinum E3 str. Alaska E43]AJF30259.1 GCN5 family acetyltransferase [Clostridium botulinum]AJF33322.1 GCN5 family acetyltransferase [Clostridium botulinum]MBY6788537.1 GNAT family N-acetyltransferase [Clostridium botulinum]MBY6816193.1 GNAT family N-acetyltransferase [Clostridium botulinum]